MWGAAGLLISLISIPCEKIVLLTNQSYDNRAAEYAQTHAHISPNIEKLRATFLSLVPHQGKILDLGSGPGRDALYFQNQGLNVTAMDASLKMAELATKNLGKLARWLTAQELNDRQKFDGIWAMASLIHVPNADLQDVFQRIARALKPGGVFLGSFIKGIGIPDRGETLPDGRFFNRVSEVRLREIVAQTPEFEILEAHTYSNSDDFHGAKKPSADFGFFNLALRKKVE